jgi:hypothetical protein
MSKQSFEEQYPKIARWVYEHEGIIEIGYNPDSPSSSFIRAIDLGGAHWEGETEYDSIDDALVDLETGIEQRLQEIYGE